MLCTKCNAKIADDSTSCGFCGSPSTPIVRALPQLAVTPREIQNSLPVSVVGVKVLGGDGLPLRCQDRVQVAFDAVGLTILATDIAHPSSFSAPYSEIYNVDVLGPGTTVRGGGFVGGGLIGGGFGFEGALIGMAIAGALNSLTTTSQTITILNLSGKGWEFWGVTDQCDPLTLRILLSPVFVRTSAARLPARSSRL